MHNMFYFSEWVLNTKSVSRQIDRVQGRDQTSDMLLQVPTHHSLPRVKERRRDSSISISTFCWAIMSFFSLIFDLIFLTFSNAFREARNTKLEDRIVGSLDFIFDFDTFNFCTNIQHDGLLLSLGFLLLRSVIGLGGRRRETG